MNKKSIKLYANDIILDKFIQSATSGDTESENTLRDVSTDIVIMNKLRSLRREFGYLIIQLVCVVHILNRLDIELPAKNINRAIGSLRKQRKFISLARDSYKKKAPSEKEITAFKALITSCEKRLDFVRQTILEENLKLTPVMEYLEIKGCSLKEDIMNHFNDIEAIINAEDDDYAPYVEEILQTVKVNGKADAYMVRLAEYQRIEAARQKRIDEERNDRKNEREKAVSEDGMTIFISHFRDCLYYMRGDAVIHLAMPGLRNALQLHDRLHSWVVLVCSCWAGKPVYRYAYTSGNLANNFSSGVMFDSEAKAKKVAELLRKENNSVAVIPFQQVG